MVEPCMREWVARPHDRITLVLNCAKYVQEFVVQVIFVTVTLIKQVAAKSHDPATFHLRACMSQSELPVTDLHHDAAICRLNLLPGVSQYIYTQRRCHKSYSIGEKRKLLASFERLGLSSRRFCEIEGIPRATWRDWRKNSKKIKETAINAKRKTLGGQGAKCSIPFRNHLLSLMKDVRRGEHILTSMHMITFMEAYYEDWLTTYTEGKRDGYKSLLKLCQDFARRHNF
ncbi:hypothetical protein DYB28_003995 [Aphanomyces astaci]|uniref:Uncharacterized protein n=1 Tax=Aphanomyces astaci TaxID=112090 RepID=A0A9X8E5H1_APHAT|nr:hypothetical protein DYB28_003995 [Aphanomyces astaci]